MGGARRGWFIEFRGVNSNTEIRADAFTEFLAVSKAKDTGVVDFHFHERRTVKVPGYKRSASKTG